MASHNKDTEELIREMEALKLENEQFRHQSEVYKKAISHNEAFMDRFIDLVYTTDLEGHICYVNQAAKRMLGYNPKDVHGKHIREFIHKDYVDIAMEAHNKTLAGGYSAVESMLIDHQGVGLPVEVVSVLNIQQGRPIGTQGVVRDITQRKKAEEASRAGEEMMKALFDAITESVALVELNGTIQALNQTCAERFGCQVKDMVGRNFSEFIPADLMECRQARIDHAIRSGRPIRFVDERDGRCLDSTIYPVMVPNCEEMADRLVVFSHDITELKKAQDELHHYRNQMAKAERLASAGTLSAMVAHELSQPLTVIRLSVQNAIAELKATRDIATVESDLDHCLESVNHVSSLIARFRDYAHTALERNRSEVHLEPILNQAIQLTEGACKQAKVRTSVHGMADLPPIVACPTDLDQLFFIFLENAFHAADPGRQHTLVITGVAAQDTIEIRFSDDCGGVAPENEARLFEPFFTTKPRGSGTGLGLCVAERIASELGGHITFDNRPGQGLTFRVEFPVSR